MTIYDELAALQQLKTVFEAITPPGSQVLQGVYIDQVDYDTADMDTLPLIMLERAINVEEDWTVGMWGGSGLHDWIARASLLLCPLDVTDDRFASKTKPLSAGWGNVIKAALEGAGNLSGRVVMIGDEGEGAAIMSTTEGGIRWWSQNYYGIVYDIPIQQQV